MKRIYIMAVTLLFFFPYLASGEEVNGADEIKITDPRSVCLIVNRDSNEIRFLDLKTNKQIGKVFLGKWVNPHMVSMTPDGRRVVTGGTRSNKAYIIDVATMKLIKTIPVDFGPEHLAITPDSRFYYQGSPASDSVSVIDLVSLKKIKTIKGFAEPLNITFLPDGSKAYVGNYSAHWVGVIDVTRHELLKKIKIGDMPRVNKLDPKKYLSEIKGISNASITRDGRYLYAADGDMGVVGVIDTREDKVIKVIKVGADPWRAYPTHDGAKMVVPNNGDETISIIDIKSNKVIATLEAGPEMIGVNFSHDKAFVISRSSSFVYVYNMKTLRPAGRIKIGTNLELETAATDAQGEKIYLTSSRDHSVYVIDGKTNAVTRIANVGLYPWGSSILEGKDLYCH
ncbi:MAG TPA: hypothetical protein ENI77_01900 [Nitrospirae bacterium]|nr:hypothetical protein [Nitrospirota bacterium]